MTISDDGYKNLVRTLTAKEGVYHHGRRVVPAVKAGARAAENMCCNYFGCREGRWPPQDTESSRYQ